MARAGKGILGGFSGKVGTVVGGTWKGIPYMRSLPNRKKNRVQTDAQVSHQAKFALASKFLRLFASLFAYSFQSETGRTGRNSALANMITQAIGGVYPNLVIDYNLVQLAKGSLKKATNPEADSIVIGKLKFMWTDDSGQGNASTDDKSILIAYCEELGEVVFTVDGATRSAGQAELDIPHLSGKVVHTWMSFRSSNGQLVADSSYTGLIAVN